MEFAFLVCALLSVTSIPHASGEDNGDTLPFEVIILPGRETLSFGIGDYKILTCRVSSSPLDMGEETPVLKWFFQDKQITETAGTSRKRLEGSGTEVKLRLDNIVDDDGGTYRCEGTLGGQSDTRVIGVEIYKKMEILSSNEQFGILGQDGAVHCNVTGKPEPSITWKFNNLSVIPNDDKYTKQPGQLMIKELGMADALTYLCDIEIPSLGDAKPFYINYTVTDPPKVDDMVFKPKNPKVGDKLELTCTTSGHPTPTISFKKGDHLVDDSMVSDGILTIISLQREDEATYTCVATNKGGTHSMTARLDVRIPPKVTISMDGPREEGDPMEGQLVSIRCTAEGDPEPTIKWKKEGMNSYYEDELVENGPTFRKEGNSLPEAEIKIVSNTIVFESITFQDAGKYTCMALNVVGNATEETTISIRYGPKFETDFAQRTFYGWQGHIANLTCQSTANPTPTYKWYTTKAEDPSVKDQEIQDVAPYTVSAQQTWEEYKISSSTLLIDISEFQEDPYRAYICEASNEVAGGLSQVVLTLVEAVAPEKPIVEMGRIMTTMVTLDIRAPSVTGGQLVTSYDIEYFPNGKLPEVKTMTKDLQTDEKTQVELMDLTMDTEYVVHVKSTNVVGSGEANVISFTTKKTSPPLRLVLESNKEGADSTSYLLKWGQPVDGENPITEFHLNFRKINATVAEDGNFQIVSLTGVEEHRKIPSTDLRQYQISGLEKDTFYTVNVTAKNGVGTSEPASMIFKTSKGGGEEETEADVGIEKDEDGDEGEEEIDGAVGSSTNQADEERKGPEGSVGDKSSSLSGHLATMLLVLLPACLTTL